MKKAMKIVIAVLLLLLFLFAYLMYKEASETEVAGNVVDTTKQSMNDEL